MNIVGKIMEIGIDVDVPKNGGGSYKGTRITYRDKDGSLKEQAIHTKALNFNPTLKAQIATLKAGDDFTMVKEKEGDFWNVKSVVVGVVQDAPSSNTGTGNSTRAGGTTAASPRSTYETPEERAVKQVYIIKQSSVSSAIALIGATTKKGTVTDVIGIAKQIEAYVLGQAFDDGSIECLASDDID